MAGTYLKVRLGPETFLLPADWVERTLHLGDAAVAAGLFGFHGIVDHEGNDLALLDLRGVFHFPPAPASSRWLTILVLNVPVAAGRTVRIAAVVDERGDTFETELRPTSTACGLRLVTPEGVSWRVIAAADLTGAGELSP